MIRILETELQTFKKAVGVGTKTSLIISFIESRIRSTVPLEGEIGIEITGNWLLIKGKTDSAFARQLVKDAARQCVKDYDLTGLKTQVHIS